jgi:hypothetical protein
MISRPTARESSQRLPLVVPKVKALNMEYEATAGFPRTLYHELTPGNDVVACGARLSIAPASPSLAETVHRQTVIDEFAVDEMTKNLEGVVHDGLSGGDDATSQTHRGLDASDVNPKVQAGLVYASRSRAGSGGGQLGGCCRSSFQR